MNIGDRVMTPAGPGAVVGWYSKGDRLLVSVALDDAGIDPARTFEAAQVTEIAGG